MRGKAAMLFPMPVTQGYQQPFRFTDLRDEDRFALQSEIGALLRESRLLGDGTQRVRLEPTPMVPEITLRQPCR